jgi:hypothetical protein
LILGKIWEKIGKNRRTRQYINQYSASLWLTRSSPDFPDFLIFRSNSFNSHDIFGFEMLPNTSLVLQIMFLTGPFYRPLGAGGPRSGNHSPALSERKVHRRHEVHHRAQHGASAPVSPILKGPGRPVLLHHRIICEMDLATSPSEGRRFRRRHSAAARPLSLLQRPFSMAK